LEVALGRIKTPAYQLGLRGRGFGGYSPVAWYGRLHTLQIGGLKIERPVTRLQTANDAFNDTLDGNIGQHILHLFIVTMTASLRSTGTNPLTTRTSRSSRSLPARCSIFR